MTINWYSNIYNSLIVVGIIIIICTMGSSSASSLTGTITGYSFIITGTLLLMGYLMNNMKGLSIISQLITVGPFVVLIGILVYMIYLLSFYFNQITNGNVSNGYYSFMNIFVVLLMVQMFIFYNGTRDKSFIETGAIGKVTGLVLYFLEIINIIVVITLGIILKYFSTDG
uniref:V-ATPase proteolipid subunit C-like domain-containing protein n=1 Tax=viral metagenome TaxID=1070528 RepID=A0A6C0K4F5_9ZZZZ